MASFKQTVKNYLFTFPSLFPDPRDASVAIFAKPGINDYSYAWIKGELIRNEGVTKWSKAMDYSDLDEREKYLKDTACKSWKDFETVRLLDIESDRIRRNFIEKNIKAILQGRIDATFFNGGRRQEYYDLVNGSFDCPVFTFPKDIKKDWGKALLDFIDFWQVTLNTKFGVSRNSDERNFWPKNIQDLHGRLEKATETLWPLVYGKSYASHLKWCDELINEVLDGEKR